MEKTCEERIAEITQGFEACRNAFTAIGDETRQLILLVLLQSADGPSLGNRAFDGSLQGAGLVMTVAENHYFSGSHHGTNTYCEGCSRNLVHIAIEET